MDEIKFCNINFRGLTKSSLLESPQKDIKFIIPVNAEVINLANSDILLQEFFSENYACFDGQIPFLIASFINFNSKIEKISGSDFIYDLCQFAEINKKMFFYLVVSMIQILNQY